MISLGADHLTVRKNPKQNKKSLQFKIPTKKVWVDLIHIIDNIVTLGTSVAVLQTLADTLETAGWRERINKYYGLQLHVSVQDLTRLALNES